MADAAVEGRPSRSARDRSASVAISGSWVARTTVIWCERAAVVRVRSTWVPSERCSGAVGSSANRTWGSWRARGRWRRAGAGTGRAAGGGGRRTSRRRGGPAIPRRCAWRSGCRCRGAGGEGGVLPGGELGDEVRFGVDPAEPVQPQPFAARGGERVHGGAVEPDLALGRDELTGETFQEGGLATAARAGDGEDLAFADADGDSGEGGGAAVRVVQAAGPENVVVRRGHHLRTSCCRRRIVPPTG